MKYTLGEFESDLISKIYAASTDVEVWREVLQSLVSICGANQCTLFFYDANCRARNFAMAARIKDGMIERYLMEFIDAEAADFHKNLVGVVEGALVLPADVVRITGKTYDQIVGDLLVQTFFPNMQFSVGIVLLQGKAICSGLGMRNFGSSMLDHSAIEFSILKTLLCNKNIGEVAQLRGTTLATTRSQVKSILQKTDTHSQAELSRLVLALN